MNRPGDKGVVTVKETVREKNEGTIARERERKKKKYRGMENKRRKLENNEKYQYEETFVILKGGNDWN